MASDQPFLVRFFEPNSHVDDERGRSFEDILNFDDETLEGSHDYIQILFPLPEGSAFNWRSPITNRAVFNAFHAREELRTNFQRGFERMMTFYGFDTAINGLDHVSVTRGGHFELGSKRWVRTRDHNHLRITRIIRSLRVLGLQAHAEAFFTALKDVYEAFPKRISTRSMEYWQRAAERPLYLAPDEDDDTRTTGPRFLVEYEEQRNNSIKP